MSTHHVFVTGGTGYIGRPLVRQLLERGHVVRALVRPGSRSALPIGAEPVVGNALAAAAWAGSVAPADTLVHLVGTPHPSPWKAREFQDIDLAAARASIEAVVAAAVDHMVYVSVAHPAPVMRAFIDARRAAEADIRASGRRATILRPWYVLGPGHRWPLALVPLYTLLERLPATAERARRLGLLTLGQVVSALVYAVEHPPAGVRTVDVPEMRHTVLETPAVEPGLDARSMPG